jgi:APA family basic amino acid/polyamine antiporter
MLRSLLRTKSLEALAGEDRPPGQHFRRALGPVHLLMLGVGAIVGAGIFGTVGEAAAGSPDRLGAGPALVVSFVLTAVACGLCALCYAEFAALAPVSGSAYTYAYATLGELVAWIIGWDLVLEYAVGNVAVAVSWSGYFCDFLAGLGDWAVEVPRWLATDPRTGASQPEVLAAAPRLFGVPIIFNLPAVGIVAALTLVLVVGIRESAWFNATMVAVKLVVLAFFCFVGMHYIRPDNWQPFAPNGWGGVQAGAAYVFFAYIGFDAVSTTAEECRNPARDLPIGILGSLAVCTLIYIAVAVIITGMVPASQLGVAEPLAVAMRAVDMNWAAGIVSFGSVVAHTAVLLVFQLGQPRILFSMSRDGLLPPAFAKTHPRFRTPHVGTLWTGLFVAVGAGLASFADTTDLCNIGTLSAFLVVCAAVLVLRYRDPHRPRPFRTPWVPLVPVLGILACLYLMFGLPWKAWIRFGVWLALGIAFYFGYGYRRSRLN